MTHTPDPNGDSNFDMDNLEGDADPFAADPGDAEGGGDPFNFSEDDLDAAGAPEPAAPPPPPGPAAPRPAGRAAAPRANTRSKASKGPSGSAGLSADIPVQVVAVLGKKTITVGDLVSLKKGEVVELNRFPNEAVDLVANGKLMAKGELVEIDGKLGVRIIKIFE